MIFKRAINRLMGLSEMSVKESSDIFHIYNFPAGPLCRGYHTAKFLQEGIFFKTCRRMAKWGVMSLEMNPIYWILRPLWRMTIYPVWRFFRWIIYRQMVVLPSRRIEKLSSLNVPKKPLGCKEIVSAEIHTRFSGRIRLRLWRHHEKGKGCVICLPQARSEGYLFHCLWPEEKGDIPMNWLQYDYRKTGQSEGQSCRFEDLVDDVQGVISYAKAFLGLQNQDCFLVSEGLGTLIANSVAKRLEGINIVQAPKLKIEPLSDQYSFKVFLGWLLGWPAHSYSLVLEEKNSPFDCEAVCDHLVKDRSFS